MVFFTIVDSFSGLVDKSGAKIGIISCGRHGNEFCRAGIRKLRKPGNMRETGHRPQRDGTAALPIRIAAVRQFPCCNPLGKE